MNDNDVKKLNRKELLELLIKEEQDNEELRARIEELEAQLNDRRIAIQNAGSIAEASLRLNGVFASAELAAAQYLENIRKCSEQQEEYYKKTVQDAQMEATQIIYEAEQEKAKKIKEADEYWSQLSSKLEAFYQSHLGLKKLLGIGDSYIGTKED